MNNVVWVRVRCVFSNLWLYYNDHLICLRPCSSPKARDSTCAFLLLLCLFSVFHSLLLIACLGLCMFGISTGNSRWSTVAEATPRRMYAPCSTLAARRSRLKAPAIVWIVRIHNIFLEVAPRSASATTHNTRVAATTTCQLQSNFNDDDNNNSCRHSRNSSKDIKGCRDLDIAGCCFSLFCCCHCWGITNIVQPAAAALWSQRRRLFKVRTPLCSYSSLPSFSCPFRSLVKCLIVQILGLCENWARAYQ